MKRSEMALIVNESEDVVFKERESSLDLVPPLKLQQYAV